MNKRSSSRSLDRAGDLSTHRGALTARLLPLYLGFAATGICVALPGAVLPVMLTHWRLQDGGGGSLLLAAWVGSSVGALWLSGQLFRALALGSLGVACGALGLTVCPSSLAPLCMLVFGLGLGTAMTAMTLVLEREATDVPRALVRLNLLWAMGASVCPMLAMRTLRTADLRALLYPVAFLFLLLAAWARSQRPGALQVPTVATSFSFSNVGTFLRAVPLSLVLFVMLTTGVEASVGGWLATYVKRGGDSLSQVIAAPTCLWVGLLLSRLFWSFSPPRFSLPSILRCNVLLVCASALALITTRHGWPFLLAAAGIGFGIGPAYPLLLARVLGFHTGGLIFFLAGLGAACLSGLTGLVSSHFDSLQIGFLVPGIATLGMLALSVLAPLSTRRVP